VRSGPVIQDNGSAGFGAEVTASISPVFVAPKVKVRRARWATWFPGSRPTPVVIAASASTRTTGKACRTSGLRGAWRSQGLAVHAGPALVAQRQNWQGRWGTGLRPVPPTLVRSGGKKTGRAGSGPSVAVASPNGFVLGMRSHEPSPPAPP